MFIINLNYIVPLDVLDAHMADHVQFLRKYYKANVFIASGRKVPRTGGIILALAGSKTEVEEIIQEEEKSARVEDVGIQRVYNVRGCDGVTGSDTRVFAVGNCVFARRRIDAEFVFNRSVIIIFYLDVNGRTMAVVPVAFAFTMRVRCVVAVVAAVFAVTRRAVSSALSAWLIIG